MILCLNSLQYFGHNFLFWCLIEVVQSPKRYNSSGITIFQFESFLSENGSQFETKNPEQNFFNSKLICENASTLFHSLACDCIQLMSYDLQSLFCGPNQLLDVYTLIPKLWNSFIFTCFSFISSKSINVH